MNKNSLQSVTWVLLSHREISNSEGRELNPAHNSQCIFEKSPHRSPGQDKEERQSCQADESELRIVCNCLKTGYKKLYFLSIIRKDVL